MLARRWIFTSVRRRWPITVLVVGMLQRPHRVGNHISRDPRTSIDVTGGEPTVGLRHGSRGNTGKAVARPARGEPGARQREGQ